MISSRISLALMDLREGIFGSPVWFYLAWQEVKQRYRRSVIGPFWITLSTGIMVAAMGPLYGHLLNQPLGPYFQHLAISLVVWNFVSGYLNEVCSAFIGAEGFIKQIKLPYSTYVLKILAKNLIMFAHNLLIVLTVLIFFPPADLAMVPLALLGFVVVIGNLFWMGIVLAMLCARFRDVPQVVASVITVLFFLTPILWQATMLKGSRRALADWNLLYHLIDIVRSPLLGSVPNLLSWFVSVGMLMIGAVVALALFTRYRARISYWI